MMRSTWREGERTSAWTRPTRLDGSARHDTNESAKIFRTLSSEQDKIDWLRTEKNSRVLSLSWCDVDDSHLLVFSWIYIATSGKLIMSMERVRQSNVNRKRSTIGAPKHTIRFDFSSLFFLVLARRVCTHSPDIILIFYPCLISHTACLLGAFCQFNVWEFVSSSFSLSFKSVGWTWVKVLFCCCWADEMMCFVRTRWLWKFFV